MYRWKIRECSPLELSHNAMTHLGRRGLRERDCYDLGWIVDFGKQTQEPAREQVGLARPGGGLHEDRAVRVERSLALFLIGWCDAALATHRPHPDLRLP